jgi:integrase
MTFQEYIDRLKTRRSAGTAHNWKNLLLKWAKDQGYGSPDDIVKEIKSSPDAPNRAFEILDKTIGFYVDSDHHLASKTVSNYYHAIKGFLRNENIELPMKKIIMPPVCTESCGRAPTPDEVRRIVAHACAKTKAAILILASSGMRLGEMVHLKISNFDLNSKPVKIRIGSLLTKTRRSRVVFITEECEKALKDYLGDRIKDPDSLIFPQTGGPSTSANALRKQIMRAIDNAGLKKKSDPESYTHDIYVHCFRKFFKTQLANSQMPVTLTETLMGHLNQNDRSYAQTTDEKLAKAYVEFAESTLTIFSVEPKGLSDKLDWVKEKHDVEIEKLRQEKEEQIKGQGERIRELEGKLAINKDLEVKRQEEIEKLEKDVLEMKKSWLEMREILNKLQPGP